MFLSFLGIIANTNSPFTGLTWVELQSLKKKGLVKGPWTREEDQILIYYIEKNGHGSWRAVPELADQLHIKLVSILQLYYLLAKSFHVLKCILCMQDFLVVVRAVDYVGQII